MLCESITNEIIVPMDDTKSIENDNNDNILSSFNMLPDNVYCVKSEFDTQSNGIVCQTMLNSLLYYFNSNKNFQQYIDIKNKSTLSLRVIEWFVTKYSELYNVSYLKTRPNGTEYYFEVNKQYMLELDGYSKKIFDPFCRSSRIILCYNGECIESTIGQLHFFSFIFKHNILDYIYEHLDHIKQDIKEREHITTLKNKKTDDNKTRKKRCRKTKMSTIRCKNNISLTIKL